MAFYHFMTRFIHSLRIRAPRYLTPAKAFSAKKNGK